MSSLQRSMLLAAAAAFLAGIAVGLAVPAVVAVAGEHPGGPNEAFVVEFAVRYDLDAGQRRKLRMVLHRRDADREQVMRKHYDNMPVAFARDLRAVLDRTDQLVFALLTEPQRGRYLSDRTASRGDDDGLAGTEDKD